MPCVQTQGCFTVSVRDLTQTTARKGVRAWLTQTTARKGVRAWLTQTATRKDVWQARAETIHKNGAWLWQSGASG